MKVGDLVRHSIPGADYGAVGLVMESEEYQNEIGHWVEYFKDRETWLNILNTLRLK